MHSQDSINYRKCENYKGRVCQQSMKRIVSQLQAQQYQKSLKILQSCFLKNSIISQLERDQYLRSSISSIVTQRIPVYNQKPKNSQPKNWNFRTTEAQQQINLQKSQFSQKRSNKRKQIQKNSHTIRNRKNIIQFSRRRKWMKQSQKNNSRNRIKKNRRENYLKLFKKGSKSIKNQIKVTIHIQLHPGSFRKIFKLSQTQIKKIKRRILKSKQLAQKSQAPQQNQLEKHSQMSSCGSETSVGQNLQKIRNYQKRFQKHYNHLNRPIDMSSNISLSHENLKSQKLEKIFKKYCMFRLTIWNLISRRKQLRVSYCSNYLDHLEQNQKQLYENSFITMFRNYGLNSLQQIQQMQNFFYKLIATDLNKALVIIKHIEEIQKLCLFNLRFGSEKWNFVDDNNQILKLEKFNRLYGKITCLVKERMNLIKIEREALKQAKPNISLIT